MVDFVFLPVKNSNCKEDVGQFLFSLHGTESQDAHPPEPIVPHQDSVVAALPESVRSILSVMTLPDVPVLGIPEQDDQLTDQENNTIAYIAGYIVRKVRQKVCSTCKDFLTGEYESENPDHVFLSKKNYVGAKEGLIYPSNVFLSVVKQLETEFRNVVEEVVSGERVKSTLVCTLSKRVDMADLECRSCHLKTLVLHLVVNIRLHFAIKENNRMLVQNKDRKNRKTFKFSHL